MIKIGSCSQCPLKLYHIQILPILNTVQITFILPHWPLCCLQRGMVGMVTNMLDEHGSRNSVTLHNWHCLLVAPDTGNSVHLRDGYSDNLMCCHTERMQISLLLYQVKCKMTPGQPVQGLALQHKTSVRETTIGTSLCLADLTQMWFKLQPPTVVGDALITWPSELFNHWQLWGYLDNFKSGLEIKQSGQPGHVDVC